MPQAVFPQLDRWLCCQGLVEVVQARRPEEVLPALLAVQAAAERGLYAAGFITYEAAAGLDPAFDVCPGGSIPLLWFGLFRGMAEQAEPPAHAHATTDFSLGPWQARIDQDEHRAAVERIRSFIAAGDTYQANYTFGLQATFAGEPWSLFTRLCRAQRAEYCAYIDTGQQVICSASPELFFELADSVLTSRPMKGTAPRGLTCEQDLRLRQKLANSTKDRAENAMIVDMVRNDIGRVAQVGSVGVSDVFRVEKYPTLLQMTTTVSGRTTAPLVEIIRALFPAASITGVPKVRAMQIIRELERRPRGVYTGCVGYVAPGGRARFNVAIRTVVVDRAAGLADYGVGGGIVWDSRADREWAECLTKTAVLSAEAEPFELLETVRWDRAEGFFLLDGHLRRLADSAEYFDFPLDLAEVRRQLAAWEGGCPQPHVQEQLGTPALPGTQRIRLRLSENGQITVEPSPLEPLPAPYRLRLAKSPIDRTDVFLYHKTTRRSVYEAARSAADDCDDVVLFNDRGEVTETTIANLVVRVGGQLFTPSVECGLLGGVFRTHLLESGRVRERIITVEEFLRAEEVWAVNSVRKWMGARLLR